MRGLQKRLMETVCCRLVGWMGPLDVERQTTRARS